MRFALAFLLGSLAMFSGCSVWNPLAGNSRDAETLDVSLPDVLLVGDLAVPSGMYPVDLEAVGLVTQLRGTGSDPVPAPALALMVSEMQTRGVKNLTSVLASPNTALVKVRARIRPGIQEGDHFDVEIRIPSESETTSLRGGYLMQTRLTEYALMGDNKMHSGHPLGLAEGPIMVDPSASEKTNTVQLGRGRILGGGIALKSRPLMLVLKPGNQSVFNSSRVETAVNKRFHTFYKGTKEGVATAKTDEYIVLKVHPQYKDNIERYVRVVRAVALRESEAARVKRLEMLEKQLLDPITSSRAALQLEALGRAGTEVLRKGIRSADAEVRFYSAEALAYLGESGAAEVLADTARTQPAFRVFALTALGIMDDFASADELHELLRVSSAETRYGAFRALSSRDSHDPVVMGERLGGQFSYHVLDTAGAPMIHVTRSRRPEIVLFGHDQRLRTPLRLEAGNQIMITSTPSGEIVVSKFSVDEPDQKRTVSTRVDDVIRAIVELGGTYPDVVQALQEAKADGALTGRFEVDALPKAGRAYDRTAQEDI